MTDANDNNVLVPTVLDDAKHVIQGKSLLPFDTDLTPEEQLRSHVDTVGKFSVLSNVGRNTHLWQLGTMHRVMNTTPSTYGFKTKAEAPHSLNALGNLVGASAATVMRGRDLVEGFVSEEVFYRYLLLPTAYLLEAADLPSPPREDLLDDIMEAYRDEGKSVAEAAEAMRDELERRKEKEEKKEKYKNKIKDLPVDKLRKNMERVNDVVREIDEHPDNFIWDSKGMKSLRGQMDGMKETYNMLEGVLLVKEAELGG